MKLNFAAAAIVAIALGAGASGQQGSDRQRGQNDDKQENRGKVVTVEGCLSSGQENGIILTADPGEITSGMATATGGVTPTITYQLVVRDPQEFASLIGRRVQVKGYADEDPRAKVKTERETETTTAGTAGEGKAKVETSEKVRVEVRKLKVNSFKPVGGSCPAAK